MMKWLEYGFWAAAGFCGTAALLGYVLGLYTAAVGDTVLFLVTLTLAVYTRRSRQL